jgi:uncharacterized protein (TIGR02452 family)
MNAGQQFYELHKRHPKDRYYSHAVIYSLGVAFFHDDDGGWTEPLEVDVPISAAVNVGSGRNDRMFTGKAKKLRIEVVMKERMTRVLFLFNQRVEMSQIGY